MANTEHVARAVEAAMGAPQNVLWSMYTAVYDYLEGRDPETLVRFAHHAAATARVHDQDDYEKTLTGAPLHPRGKGRPIGEIFAAHAPQT